MSSESNSKSNNLDPENCRHFKQFIPDVITPDEASLLVEIRGHGKRKGFKNVHKHPVIEKVKTIISSLVEPNWENPSYIRIEKGWNHKWHVDTGNNNHMPWCAYGGSVLLVNDEKAGFLEYRDGTKLLPEDHYCSLAIHSSDVEHRVVQDGNRITLLAFIQRQSPP